MIEGLRVGQTAQFEEEVTAARVAEFAALSGDYNPLHVDPAYAAGTDIGRPIAHGALLVAFVSRMLGMHLPGTRCLILSMRVRFGRPIAYPVRLIIAGELQRFSESRGEGVVAVRISEHGASGHVAEADVVFSLHTILGDRIAAKVEVEQKERVSLTAEQGPASAVLVVGGTGGIGSVLISRISHRAPVVCISRSREGRDGDVTYIAADLERNGELELALADLNVAAFSGVVHLSSPPIARVRMIDDPDGVRRQYRHAVEVPLVLGAWAARSDSAVRRIVLVGSTNGTKQTDAGSGAYALAKASMESLVTLLARDLARHNITCNVVRPGFVHAGLNQGTLARTAMAIAGRTHTGRLTTPDDVANVIEFLLSEHAAQVNGAVLTVDGGLLPQ